MRLASISLALATTASGLALAAAAPAVAAPAAHSEVSTHASVATAMASWHTQRHESLGPGKYLETTNWQRRSGVRVMQVKARCWGNNSQMKVNLVYKRRGGLGWKTAKSGKWACNGRYGIVRISNAGHSTYYATFTLNKKHTVEYWVQYYK
ncbi:hypothetical protein AB0H88_03875 [Nonomuraea sp. NPDC050680]|uniref:hypothetical protein n=1 Tax=Nonomuraea sp. NPDC050680 TaxID=3154630 RepID=UPI0033CF5108